MNMLSHRGLCAGWLLLGEVRIRTTNMALFFYTPPGATHSIIPFQALSMRWMYAHEAIDIPIQGVA